MSQKDRVILRELAARHMALAAQDVNREREKRIRQINGLVCDRPVVWLDELPWNELAADGELRLQCESDRAKAMEWYFRTVQYRWKYIQADMVVEDCYYISKAFDDSGIGMPIQEDVLRQKGGGYIVSHRYKDQLDTEEKVDSLLIPTITARPDKDREHLAFAGEVLEGIMPVRLRGHGTYHAPWDTLSMLRGVEPALMDMVERPKLIHRTMERLTEIATARYGQMEKQGLLDFNLASLHCTPPYSDELPAPGYDGTHVRMKDIWFRGMAQMLSSVSPAMHEEFDLQYMKPLMAKCGLVYYGCCEPLDKVIPYLKEMPNMRKIGVSPWADVWSSAEQMGGDYVFARKPNPALVAGDFDAEAVERETEETLKACLRYGCPCELVLKDISTVSGRARNLVEWVKTVQRTIDSVYA